MAVMMARMGEAIVFLHGFTHTGASWTPVIDALGERYRALAPDLRGHGDASDARPVDLAAVIADIGVLAPAQFGLVGYSMGGRIALHVAFAVPDRVRWLVLVGASPGLADPHERDARRRADERLADELERSTIEEFARRWAQIPVLAGAPPDVAARAHTDRLRNAPAGLARALRGLGTGALVSLWDRLPALELPVSLLVGERDGKFLQVARAMRQGLPRAQLIVVPGAGHAVHLEAPAVVAERIVAVAAPQAAPPR